MKDKHRKPDAAALTPVRFARSRCLSDSRDRMAPRSVRGHTARNAVSAILGVALVVGGAYAATSWVVNLNSGSSAEGQAATIQNLTVTAVSSPAPTNQLYPGGTGDVVLTISNPNPYPVTVTGVDLPTNTTYASGYTTAALSTTQTIVSPRHRATLSGTSPRPPRAALTRTTAATVGASGNANNPLTVTLTNDASMTAAVPTTRPSTASSH